MTKRTAKKNGRKLAATDTEAVVLSVLIGGEKYGLELRDAYEVRAKKKMPLGSVYTTLDRMEAKGFVESWYGGAEDGTESRGGNRRRYFRITGEGAAAYDAFRVRVLELGKSLPARAGGVA